MNNQLWQQILPHIEAKNRLKKPNGKGWYGPLKHPFRPDTHPSFSVLPDHGDTAGAYTDHATKESGSLVDLLRSAGIEPAPIDKDQPITWHTWASARRLDSDRLSRAFGVRQSRPGEIRFPTPCGVERVRGISWGPSEPRWAKSGGGGCAYGLDQCADFPGPIYLVEGEPSVWACWQSGVAAVCSLLGATSSIAAIIPDLASTGREIRIAYDLDAAGETGARQAQRELAKAGAACTVIELPAALKKGGDVDDLHRRTGDDGLRKALAACPIKIDLPSQYYRDADSGYLLREPKDENGSPAFVAETPIAVSRVSVDVYSAREVWTLAWANRALDVPHDHCVTPRELVKYSARGLPVAQHTASSLAKYLFDYERLMRRSIPRDECARATGWHRTQDGWGFLCGADRYGAAPKLEEHGDGTDTLIKSIHAQGSADEWRAMMNEVVAHKGVRLVIAATAASALLARMGLRGFTVDLCGVTSVGKTSALNVAASVCGDPTGYKQGWNATAVGIETMFAALRGMTVMLDDTKDATHPSVVSGAVYSIHNGYGRQRGSRTGRRETMQFSSILISTGEAPIADFDEGAGGLRARTLQLWGSPWGARNDAIGLDIRRWEATAKQHYGHGMRALVAQLVEQDDEFWQDARARHAKLVEKFVARINQNHPRHQCSGRIATYCATVELAGRMLGAAADIEVDGDWVDLVLFDQIATAAAEADRSAQALFDIVSWMFENPLKMRDHGSDPKQEIVGTIRQDGMTEKLTECAITARVAKEQLKRMGYDPGAVVAAWKDHGWAHTQVGRKAIGKSAREIVLTDKALDLAETGVIL